MTTTPYRPPGAPDLPPALVPARPPGAKPLAPPRFTGSTSAALTHALIGAALGIAMLTEDHRGYAPAVFTGPRSITEALPGDPWVAWGVLFLTPALLVLGGRGQPAVRYAVGLLAVAWSAFGASALLVGIRRADASCIGGIIELGLAVLVWQAALALGRRR